MSLSDSFLRNHRQVELLIFAKKHERDWVLLVALVVLVGNWNDRGVRVRGSDVSRCDLKLRPVRLANLMKPVVNRAFWAHTLACTLFAANKGVHLVTDKWHKTKTMRDKLIMKC